MRKSKIEFLLDIFRRLGLLRSRLRMERGVSSPLPSIPPGALPTCCRPTSYEYGEWPLSCEDQLWWAREDPNDLRSEMLKR